MDLKASNSKYFEAPPSFHSHQQETRVLEGSAMFYRAREQNPFLDAFQDPLCKLHLKETSEFVKSFPAAENSTNLLDASAAQRRREFGLNPSSSSLSRRTAEAPPTPGRPIFSFSVGNLPRKGFPSKWDDAEKWLIGGHDSPAHHHHHHHNFRPPPQPQPSGYCPNSRFTDTRVITAGFSEDKFTNEVHGHTNFPAFKCSEPSKQGFLFSNAAAEESKATIADANEEVKHRDIGTEMTPLGSSTTSRCPTPFKSTSPARHNTPDNRSGPLVISNSTTTIDITQIQFDSVTSNWSSREEEEEEISKSLRHFELTNTNNNSHNNGELKKKAISESRTFASWEEEEKTKCCLRYQREEAKIQAWVNLQRAKAEAQSRKLEVKIEKMRSNLEDKLMKKMGIVHRKAEEWRTASRIQHCEQMQRGKNEKINNNGSSKKTCYLPKTHSCGCFPCTNGTANQYPY